MSMKLMVRILEEANLTRPQSAVLVAMAENANDDGSRCFPSVDLIAWKAGYKPRNVVDIIRDLRAIGVLEMVNKATAQRATEYTIHLDLAPPKQTFEDWKKENGRHSDRVADGSSGVQSHVENAEKPRENAPVQTHEGCNLTSTGVQSHVRGVQSHVENAEKPRENAPEPVNEPVNEPVRGTSQLPGARTKPQTTPVPNEFVVTDKMREQAVKYGVKPEDIDSQTELFLDNHRAKGHEFVDWAAAWRTWMQRAPTFAPRGPVPFRSRQDPKGYSHDDLEDIALGKVSI